MNFKTDLVIGLEIHAELNTKTKLFCGSPRKGSEAPNTRVCPICLGHPGSKPVLNKQALDYAIKLCLALESKLDKELVFSRKSYFYPDMSKNFQITQFERPLGNGGSLKLSTGRDISLRRIHMEEDPAAIIYPKGMLASNTIHIDYNRSGNPLVEIVTEPVLHSPEEARELLNQLISILTYLEIFDINTCLIKSDANISIKESGYTRVEIKNISGFKELEKALKSEITRQKLILQRGEKIQMETRGWDPLGKATRLMRTKETEEDYGYIIEPDLSIIDIKDEMVDVLKKEIPELAYQKAERFVKQYKIDKINSWIISKDKKIAAMFEKVAARIEPKLAARWFRGEVLRVLNYNNKTIGEVPFKEKEIIELLEMLAADEISESTAKKMMEDMVDKKISPRKYVEKKGLLKLKSEDKIGEMCDKVIKENKKAVDDYLSGREEAIHFLVGQLMKLTRGKAAPDICKKLLKEKLKK